MFESLLKSQSFLDFQKLPCSQILLQILSIPQCLQNLLGFLGCLFLQSFLSHQFLRGLQGQPAVWWGEWLWWWRGECKLCWEWW